jgi:two-component system phosphate regulon sensor histidine kinase PhoR
MPKLGRLFWKLFLVNALLMATILATCTWLIVAAVEESHSIQQIDHLRRQAETIREVVRDLLTPAEQARLEALVKSVSRPEGEGMRVSIWQPDGRLLASVEEFVPSGASTIIEQPEFRQALHNDYGVDIRRSSPVEREMMYVAVRIGPEADPQGVVRVATPIQHVIERAAIMQQIVWTIAMIGLLAIFVFALGLARIWSTPIRRITSIAKSLSRGDLSARVPVSGNDELGTLALSLNDMRDNLNSQLETIDRQRQTLEALLSQLHEGVIVSGPNGKIVLINPAAVRLLGLDATGSQTAKRYENLAVEQCVAQHNLQQLLLPGNHEPVEPASAHEVEDADSKQMPFEELRIQLEGKSGPLSILARASDIRLPQGRERGQRTHRTAMGRLMVLTDITELSRLIQFKTDFAANASHELRTPLSAIRAAAETLNNIDLASDASSARHFVDMIVKHSNRMEAMVDDLLSLSRIESSPGRFQPEKLKVADTVADLANRYHERIHQKHLALETEIDTDVQTMYVNPYLLRMVLDNLVDNAIKFTTAEGTLRVVVSSHGDGHQGQQNLSITVSDTGCGIPMEDRARVFERFYQVGKSRSGEGRGTGLGLSIVRHAVSAMHGTVTLESELNRGTSITVTIPQPIEASG